MLESLLTWSPRIIAMLLGLWLGVFALDVFDEGRGVLKTALAFAIHLTPTWIVVAALVLAWRWEWVGALAFTAIGLGLLRLMGGKRNWETVLTILSPPFVIAALYLASWMYE